MSAALISLMCLNSASYCKPTAEAAAKQSGAGFYVDSVSETYKKMLINNSGLSRTEIAVGVAAVQFKNTGVLNIKTSNGSGVGVSKDLFQTTYVWKF